MALSKDTGDVQACPPMGTPRNLGFSDEDLYTCIPCFRGASSFPFLNSSASSHTRTTAALRASPGSRLFLLAHTHNCLAVLNLVSSPAMRESVGSIPSCGGWAGGGLRVAAQRPAGITILGYRNMVAWPKVDAGEWEVGFSDGTFGERNS